MQPGKSNRSLWAGKLPPPPTGCVWVEWVGEASPLDNPAIQYGLMTGKYTRDQQKVIRRLAKNRIARVHRHSRTMTRGNGVNQILALSQDWRWGNHIGAPPGHEKSYVKALPYRDADAIKSCVSGHEFIVHDERDGEALDLIHQERGGPVKLVTVAEYRDGKSFLRASGAL